jgi:protein-tyrosine phosphatase
VSATWDPGLPGSLTLPSGRRVLGRAWRDPAPEPPPALGIYLLARPPSPVPWEVRWVRWRDFGLPADVALLRDVLTEALDRSGDERVEVGCRGGTGRTGTALACLAVLDGVPPEEAVTFVRTHYRPRAVETKAQAAFVARFR